MSYWAVIDEILHFGPSGFSDALLHIILISLHGNSFIDVPTVRNNGLIYGLHHFGGSHWAVIDVILAFWSILRDKRRVFGPLRHSIMISLHRNSFKMSQLCVTGCIIIWFTSLWGSYWAVTDEILHFGPSCCVKKQCFRTLTS